MPGSWWWDLLLGLAAGRGGLVREALRLLPDVLRLLPRLAADRSLPRGVRVRLALLLAYLASPIDLVPDFIPVIGYADLCRARHKSAYLVTDGLPRLAFPASLPAVT